MSQFYVWDENNVNIQNSTDFLNDNERKNGFVSGTAASSSRVNTALRQATLITAGLMEMLTAYRDNSALTVQSSINEVKLAISNGFKNFDASNMTVAFSSSSHRYALTSGESLSTSMSKISGWLSTLKELAFKTTVSTSDIVNGAITTDKLAGSSVTTAKIANGTITYPKMANNSVHTNAIVDGHVTGPKIANYAITTDKIADSAIGTSKFASGANCICPRAVADKNGNEISTIYSKLTTYQFGSNTYFYSIGSVVIAKGIGTGLSTSDMYLGARHHLYCDGRQFMPIQTDSSNVEGTWILTSMSGTAAGLDYATLLYQRIS